MRRYLNHTAVGIQISHHSIAIVKQPAKPNMHRLHMIEEIVAQPLCCHQNFNRLNKTFTELSHPNSIYINIDVSYLIIKTLTLRAQLSQREMKVFLRHHLDQSDTAYLHYKVVNQAHQSPHVIALAIKKSTLASFFNFMQHWKIKPCFISASPLSLLTQLPKSHNKQIFILQQMQTYAVGLVNQQKLISYTEVMGHFNDLVETIQNLLLSEASNANLVSLWLITEGHITQQLITACRTKFNNRIYTLTDLPIIYQQQAPSLNLLLALLAIPR